jgi:hypothetical protein
MRRQFSLFAMLGSLLLGQSNRTPEQEFWRWFEQNESLLFNFETNREKVFDGLAKAMRQVHPDLTFEFGPVENSKREFVISADGIKDGFPKVISLFEAAPKLARWSFIKFRPRRIPMDIAFGGISIRAKEVFFTLDRDENKVGITLFMPGHTDESHEKYLPIAYLLLDQAIGEFDVETKVGFIEIKSVSDSPKSKRPLSELPKAFDALHSSPRPKA